MKAFHPYTLRKIHSMALTLESKNVELVKVNNFLFMSLVRIIVDCEKNLESGRSFKDFYV